MVRVILGLGLSKHGRGKNKLRLGSSTFLQTEVGSLEFQL